VDGYAVRAENVASAGLKNPVSLRLIGRVAAGEIFKGELHSNEAVRIFTGSPLPKGADAVVMQEDTRLDPNRAGEVSILDAVRPWENVRFRGEDIKTCGAVAEPGEILNANRIAVLTALGCADVRVGRIPKVGLLATGSELIEAGNPISGCKIYESNRAAIAALVRQTGGEAKIYPIVPDELNATRAAIQRAFSECDFVITCGGVSVGEMDFVKTAFDQLGGKLDFWKVAIKPGRPFVFGQLEEKFLFGLPGNPVSAFVTFLLLARPALLRWQGAREISLPSHPGVLAEPLSNPGGRRHFMRVTVDPTGKIRSAGIQASHILTALAKANGLVDAPPKTTFAAGEAVQVLRWD
jgi:molybdopterin molybdotransferase